MCSNISASSYNLVLEKINPFFKYGQWTYSLNVEDLDRKVAVHVCWRPELNTPISIPFWLEKILPWLCSETVRNFLLFKDEEDPWVAPLNLMYLTIELSSESEVWGLYASICDSSGVFWSMSLDLNLPLNEKQPLEVGCFGGNHTGDKDIFDGLLPDDLLRESNLFRDW